MKKTKLTFAQALKQQGLTAIAIFAFIGFLGYQLSPLDSAEKLVTFLITALFFTTIGFFFIKKATNQVLCNGCNSNLYHILEGHGPIKLEVNYCPVCGVEINA